MLSIQDIQAKSFEKAVFGGYDMRTVDEFLETVAESYSVLHKENATLKAKMKVLIEKIEEYRTVEESMRKALLSAQNIADDMVNKAKSESEELKRKAETEVQSKLYQTQKEIKLEAEKLEKAKELTQAFAMKITQIYQGEIDTILQLSNAIEQVKAEIPVEYAMPEPMKAEDLEDTTNLSEEFIKNSDYNKKEDLKLYERQKDYSDAFAVNVKKSDYDTGKLQFGIAYSEDDDM